MLSHRIFILQKATSRLITFIDSWSNAIFSQLVSWCPEYSVSFLHLKCVIPMDSLATQGYPLYIITIVTMEFKAKLRGSLIHGRISSIRAETQPGLKFVSYKQKKFKTIVFLILAGENLSPSFQPGMKFSYVMNP